MKYILIIFSVLLFQTSFAQFQKRKIAPLTELKKFKGKYPYEIKLINGSILTKRLKALMRNDFKDLNELVVASPVKIEGDVFSVTGCYPHMCPEKRYVIAYNFKTDALSVYLVNILNGKSRYILFSEDGEYPKELLNE